MCHGSVSRAAALQPSSILTTGGWWFQEEQKSPIEEQETHTRWHGSQSRGTQMEKERTVFTGLVEGCGRVHELLPQAAGVRLAIDTTGTPLAESLSSAVTQDRCAIGDSIAINGCCLTVIAIDGSTLSFEAGSETLSKTNLGELSAGDPVNLERSLPVHGRLGGHFVQGHVDGVGIVQEIRSEPAADGNEWIFMTFTVDAALTAQMVSKGSVTVDGVSLTIVTVTDTSFSVALIPHTLEVTTLGRRGVGAKVNLETDILGKYVQKLLGTRQVE